MKTFSCVSIIIIVSHLYIGPVFANTDLRQVAEELNDDIYYIFIDEASYCNRIIEKYSHKKKLFIPLFTDILKDPSFDSNTKHNIVYLLAILREKIAISHIKRIEDDKSFRLKGIADFYYLRINEKKGVHLKNLTKLLDELLEMSVVDDSTLITYLPFLEDLNLSLDYLNKLSKKSDGAGSELLHWALDYILLENKNERAIIEKSEVFKYFYPKKNK